MMTDDELRVAIAEKCGWKRCRSAVQSKDDPVMRGWLPPNKKGSGWHDVPRTPDYLTDLNAMHEADKVLTDYQLHSTMGYGAWLEDIISRDLDIATVRPAHYAKATARQRAEAFARVCFPERFNR